MDRRALMGAGVALGMGWVTSGCNSSRRPSNSVPLPVTPPATPPATLPSELTEGRLVTGHYAALGLPGTRIEEPLAPPGYWRASHWGWTWVPNYYASFGGVLAAALLEIELTEPRWEPDGAVVVPGVYGPRTGTRLVLVPGPTFAYGSLLAAGLYMPKAWQEIDGTFSDVIFLGLTDNATRTAVPAGHSYKRYAPAAGHEFSHQHTGILTH